jgi:hypothetical protein
MLDLERHMVGAEILVVAAAVISWLTLPAYLRAPLVRDLS